MPAAKQKALFKGTTPRKPAATATKVNKTEGFSVGVSPTNYYILTGIAEARGIPRMTLMNEIVDQYIKNVLAR